MSYKKNRVTIKDIAAKTGYTANTVSRALKKCSDISKTTQEYIRKSQMKWAMSLILEQVA